MATLRELVIKISANSQSFQSEISRASRMGESYYKTMQQGGRQAAASSRETQKALVGVTAQLNETRAAALSLAGGMAGAFATSRLIQYADTWNMMNGRLKLASTSADDFANAQKNLMDISQRTDTSLEANTQLYSRIALAMRDAGYASKDVASVTETVATSLKLSGASVAETASVVTQLSQALSSGVLSGEEFRAVMENGGRLARLLADGLGVSIGQLRQMAKAQQLTTDKIIPLLTNVDQLRKEFEQLAPTISGSAQKVENAFLSWIGDADKANGASAALAGGLDALAENINGVATAAGVLVALGVSRYLGNMALGAKSAAVGMISATKSEIALAEAQLRGTQISTARARASVYRAQKALAATTDIDKQAAAEKRLAAAQASLSRNSAARAAAQTRLSSVASVGTRAIGGMVGMLGGIPGLIMMGAGAWYMMYQNTQQARKEAQDYAAIIDQVREKTGSLTLSEASDSEGKTRQALDEQNRLIADQAEKVRKLKDSMTALNNMMANPGMMVGDVMFNHLKSLTTARQELAEASTALAVEQERLNQMQSKAADIGNVLAGLEDRRNTLIKQQAAEQNKAYQSLLVMNGQYTEFNRLLGIGNGLLQERQGLVNAPMRMPQADLTQQQQDALKKSGQDLELSKLKGRNRENRRLEFSADALGLSNDPDHQTARQQYINDNLQVWDNNEASKPKRKSPKSDADKLSDKFTRIIQQQKEQLALSGDNTELAKMKFDISQGELSSLESQKKEILLQNAALIDQKKIAEQLQSFKDGLADSNATAKKKGDIDFIGAGMGSQARDRLKEMEDIKSEFADRQRDLQRDFQNKNIDGDLYKKENEALQAALNERLGIQADYYKKSDEQSSDWVSGVTDRLADYADEATNYSQAAADATSSIINGSVSELTDGIMGILTQTESLGDGLKNVFVGIGETVIQTLAKMGAQWLVLQGVQLLVGKSAGAAAAAGMTNQAVSMAAMAQLSAYASTAAIPIVGPAMAPMAAATAAAATAPMVAMVTASSLAGMAHDGLDKVPETGTWLLQKGERVVTANTSAKLDSTLEKVQQNKQGEAARNIGNINIQNSFSGKPDDATLLAIDARNRSLVKQIKSELTADVIKPQGEFGNALKSIYPNRRRG